MLESIKIGIIEGSIIGLLAIGIVLVYKGARVFNFAQAEFGSAAGFFLLWFQSPDRLGLPYPVAVVLSLLAIGVLGWLMERLVIRPLFNAPRVTLLVATAGVALLAIALELKLGGVEIHQIDPIVRGSFKVPLLDLAVKWQELIAIGVLAGLGIGLSYFFNKADLGLAVLATSQEPVATELVGISTKRISSFIWVFAALLGATAGILRASDTTFTAGFMTVNFLLLAFTAAVVGGITSLAGAFVGGQLIGIIGQLSSYLDINYIKAHEIEIPGFDHLIVFIVLLVILIVRPSGLLGKEA